MESGNIRIMLVGYILYIFYLTEKNGGTTDRNRAASYSSITVLGAEIALEPLITHTLLYTIGLSRISCLL